MQASSCTVANTSCKNNVPAAASFFFCLETICYLQQSAGGTTTTVASFQTGQNPSLAAFVIYRPHTHPSKTYRPRIPIDLHGLPVPIGGNQHTLFPAPNTKVVFPTSYFCAPQPWAPVTGVETRSAPSTSPIRVVSPRARNCANGGCCKTRRRCR